jgi:hypothetical protein
MATEIKKPTANSEAVAPTNSGTWSNTTPENAYDGSTGGDTSTTGTIDLEMPSGATEGSWQFNTWAAAGQTYTDTVLKLRTGATIQKAITGYIVIQAYDGVTSLGVLSNSPAANTTYTLNIGTTSLTNLKIRCDLKSDYNGGPVPSILTITDIWTEGTYTEVALSGKKSACSSSI